MKIVINSYVFFPLVVGMQSFAEVLVTSWAEQGTEVTVFSPFALGESVELIRDYKIIRDKSNNTLFQEVKNCDVFIHNSVSLCALIPLLFYRKNWVVIHHMILVCKTLKLNIRSESYENTCP
jgi:hypothetical protein